ncbi:MAG: hypothetical protein HYX53_17330, partial [Chloroflexi bacterium]|nr:hypothetical protein [Chloroflexota bacterium]
MGAAFEGGDSSFAMSALVVIGTEVGVGSPAAEDGVEDAGELVGGGGDGLGRAELGFLAPEEGAEGRLAAMQAHGG